MSRTTEVLIYEMALRGACIGHPQYPAKALWNSIISNNSPPDEIIVGRCTAVYCLSGVARW